MEGEHFCWDQIYEAEFTDRNQQYRPPTHLGAQLGWRNTNNSAPICQSL
jgi:hypothetical protein